MEGMTRLCHTTTLLAAIGILNFCALAKAQAKAQKTAPDCHSTAQRVLLPVEKALKAVQQAETQYLGFIARDIAAVEDKLAKLRATKTFFASVQKAEREAFGHRLTSAEEVIAEITAKVNDSIAGSKAKLAKLRNDPNPRQHLITNEETRLTKLRESLRAKSASGYKPKLGTKSIKNWEAFIVTQTTNRDARMAEFDKGDVSMYLRPLRYSASWNTIQETIETTKTYLRDQLLGRAKGYHLHAIRWTTNWENLQIERKKREDRLALVRSEIARGIYMLHVPTLNYTTNRNAVQKLIADAERKYRETVAAFPAKTYAKHNPKIRHTVSNGYIEEERRKVLEAMAEFRAAGDLAKVHVPGIGYTTNGVDIRGQLRAAREAKNQRSIERLTQGLSNYAKAKADWLASKQKKVEYYDEALHIHRQLHKEDLKAQRRNIDERLARALAETPCGSGSSGTADPRAEAVIRHRNAALGAGDKDGKQRLEEYDDWVYVESDGTVHGDPEEGLRRSLGEPDVKAPEDSLETGAQTILKLKDLVDWLSANGALIEAKNAAADISDARQKLEDFIHAMSSLDPTAPNFFKLRKQLRRKHLKDLQNLLSRGALSDGGLKRIIEALKKSGSGTKQTRDTIKRLEGLIATAANARKWSLPRFDRILASVREIKDAAKLSKVKAAARSTIASLGKTIEGGLDNMNGLDKGLLGLSVLAAAAETYDRIASGQDYREATGRAAINLAIELAIAGFPITAAAEVVSQLIFVTAGAVTGNEAYSAATVEKVTKYIVEKVLVDNYAAGWQWMGEKSVAFDRWWHGQQSVDATLAGVDKAKVRASLQTVEGMLNALPPGDPAEGRLLKSRRALRQILRASPNK